MWGREGEGCVGGGCVGAGFGEGRGGIHILTTGTGTGAARTDEMNRRMKVERRVGGCMVSERERIGMDEGRSWLVGWWVGNGWVVRGGNK